MADHDDTSLEMITPPHGGTLTRLLVPPQRRQELTAASRDWASWDLTPRQLCDMELLLCGAFSPLSGFMGRADYQRVCQEMRLADGTFWPLPVALDVSEQLARALEPGAPLCLRDPEGVVLAVLHVQDVWRAELDQEAEQVYGTASEEHAGVRLLRRQTNPWYVGGELEGLQAPLHHDFRLLRHTPAEVRRVFQRRGWRRVMAYQTRNPIHRMHLEFIQRAAREHQTNLLVHPVVGMTKPGDVDHFTRVRCYMAVQTRFRPNTMMLSLLNLSMRMAGPRETLLHAIIRRNYGCSHLLVGRDHAGPGPDAKGQAFYEPYAAQELLQQHQQELGISMVPIKELVYAHDLSRFCTRDEVPAGSRVSPFSGSEIRSRLSQGQPLQSWASYPEVITELKKTYPPRHRQGFTIFFTGLSGAGKSTLANVLLDMLLEYGGRPVTLLDGDIVRKNLSSELTFSREHRDLNIMRIGFVASEITKNKGIAICAPIAPYDQVRKEVRELIAPLGGFILVHVATPLSVCEERDRKGMYAKARAGLIKGFTGIDDPYEEPEDAELVVDTTNVTPDPCVQQILLYLEKEGYLGLEE